MKTYFEMEFKKVANSHIELIERDIDLLKDYEPKFEEIKIINSSLRIDSVIAKLVQTNRDEVKEMIKDKKIMHNYDILKDNAKLLQEGDVFSIRKIGKFKFDSIMANTKKDNLVLLIKKYISE